MARKLNELCWPDARGWIGIGVYSLTIIILLLTWLDPTLREDEFFKTIATLVIGTGFINGVVSWAYAATKGGGELADKNAAIVETAATVAPLVGKNETPQDVRVVNPPSDPVPAEIKNGDGNEELPDYAR